MKAFKGQFRGSIVNTSVVFHRIWPAILTWDDQCKRPPQCLSLQAGQPRPDHNRPMYSPVVVNKVPLHSQLQATKPLAFNIKTFV